MRLNYYLAFIFFITFASVNTLCSQIIYTIAGNGVSGYNGDNISSSSAQVGGPTGIATDTAGNIYFCDQTNNRIRKIAPNGMITTVVGTGVGGFSGDGGPALNAKIAWPYDVAIDRSGNLYIADMMNKRIRKVSTSGIITTIAGTGVAGYNGDNIPAVTAQLNNAFSVAVDTIGNVYIGDVSNNRIRKVDLAGIITTFAGTGTQGYASTNGPAISSNLYGPGGMVFDKAGNMYFSDTGNDVIRKIDPSGMMTRFAGAGYNTFIYDGGPALNASIRQPNGICVDKFNNVYICDVYNYRIRKVDTLGIITSVAGTGVNASTGDGGPAANAAVAPYKIAIDKQGNLYYTDSGNNRLRKIVNTCTAPAAPASTTPASSLNVCSGKATVLSALDPGLISWYATSTGTAVLGTGFTYTTPAITSNTVYYAGTKTCTGSTTRTSFSVTVQQGPVVSATMSNSVVCIGSPVTLSGNGASTYTWTGGVTDGVAFIPAATSTYTVAGSNGTACNGSAIVTVSVNPGAILTINNGTICLGQTFTLNPSGAITYTYSSGSSTVSPTTNTTYTISGTNANGCTGTAISSVTVNPLPVITVNSGSVCPGMTFTMSPSGAVTYSYSSGSNIVTPLVNSTYTVTGTSVNGCINGIGAVSSVVINTVVPLITVNSGSVCPGMTFTMSPSGAATYSYSSGSNTVAPTINSTYTVTGTDINGCINSAGAVSSVAVSTVVPAISVNSGTICSNQTFTIVPSGASTYTYSSGSNTVTPSATSSYTVTGTDINGCINSIGAISTVNVNAAPSLTAIQNASVCVGTSTLLNVSGANTYSWTTGAATSSISVSPTITTIYSVTGTNSNNCNSTQTVAVTVNPNCQDVWPGDANSDGIADNFDVLELGLHFSQTGSPRGATSNAWQSYFANNWTGSISSGKNVNHSDCNGDGSIDNNDTLAIYTNYGLTHAFKPAEQAVVNPQLSVVPDQIVVTKGNWGTSSVFLGEASAPIANINGLAFTVSFDQDLIDANSFYIEYPASFINAGNQNLSFAKSDFANGKLYTATTHTITNNVSGNGKIAVLHYKIKSTLVTDEILNIGVTQARQSNANGVLMPLTTGTGSVTAIGASVGMDELSNGNSIGIYPNPANASVTIHSGTLLEKVEVLSLTGQTILSERISGIDYKLNLTEIANGVYFVNVYTADQKVSRKKLIVQR